MRLLRIGAAALTLLTVATLAALLWYRSASLPLTAGRVEVFGNTATVTIERDAEGIPHISAASEHDAAFGLGYAHAQDRLWQMEMNRRIAAGRVAELAGAGALETDMFLRTLGIDRQALTIYQSLDADHRSLLDAYAAGVNAYLATRRGPLPPEFLLMRAPAPRPWTAADSIGWSLMMAWDLARHSLTMELRRLQLAQRFSVAEINDIYPPMPGEPAPPVADFVELYRLLGLKGQLSAIPSDAVPLATAPAGGFGEAEAVGSNAWVVSGARTVSGKPLLANDPHLGLTTPSLWYFAALRAPGLEVTGATLPGVPGVVLGRTERVAWSFTNTGADQQDLYLERINPQDANQYETPEGWAQFSTHTERIGVKGGDDVELVVRQSRHGPILSGLASIDRVLARGPYVLALRWTALEPGDRTMVAIRALNKANNIEEAERALAQFDLVTQSALLADVEGRIGFVVTGRIPLRAADNDLRGIAPAPGWDARYDWTGYLQDTDKPRQRDPASGLIVTTNTKVGSAPFPRHLTYDWFTPYRSERIGQLLDERARHDVSTFKSIQADVVSLAARETVALLRETQPGTAAGREAMARLSRWDGAMGRELPEPLLFHAWMREFKRQVFADDLGPLTAAFVDASGMTPALLGVLAGRAQGRDWCDERTTTHRFETCSALAADALDTAVAQLTQSTGLDVAGLRWGDAHLAILQHRPLSRAGWLARLFEQRIEYPGDTYTINVGALSHESAAPFVTRHAASLRAIYDLGDPAGSVWIHPGGQSGSPFSAGYASMLLRWRDVDYLPMGSLPGPGSVLELVPRSR